MGSVFQHWVAHSSTFIFDSCLLTLLASRRRLFRSTTIRWSLRTLGVLSSSVIKASTRASGGYTPLTLEQENRRLCKKAESSGASSRSSSFNLSKRRRTRRRKRRRRGRKGTGGDNGTETDLNGRLRQGVKGEGVEVDRDGPKCQRGKG